MAGDAWSSLKQALERAALVFKAINKRPAVLVIDGADNIAKSSRKLAIDILTRAKARNACCH